MNFASDTWNGFSETLFGQLVSAFWQGSLAILLVWGICLAFRNCSPRVRCWLWRIAFAKLVLALVWFTPWEWAVLPAQRLDTEPRPGEQLPLSAIPQESTAAETSLAQSDFHPGWSAGGGIVSSAQGSTLPLAANSNTEQFANAPATAAAIGSNSGSLVNNLIPSGGAGSPAAHRPASSNQAQSGGAFVGNRLAWQAWLVFCWGVGVLVGLVVLVRQHFAARRLVRRSTNAMSGDVFQLQREIGQTLGLRKLPSVRYSREIEGPVLTGILRPVVLLPARWQAAPRADHLHMALTHEFAHVRRRDLLWNWLPALARVVFFFHPLVWLASRVWALDVEQACDDLAVNEGRLPRRNYAEFLVWIVAPRRMSLAPMALGAASPFSHLKRRLLTMKNRSQAPRRLWLAVGGIGLLGLGILAPIELTAQDAPPNPAQQSGGGGATTQSGGGSGQNQGGDVAKTTATGQSGGGAVTTTGPGAPAKAAAQSGGGVATAGQNTTAHSGSGVATASPGAPAKAANSVAAGQNTVAQSSGGGGVATAGAPAQSAGQGGSGSGVSTAAAPGQATVNTSGGGGAGQNAAAASSPQRVRTGGGFGGNTAGFGDAGQNVAVAGAPTGKTSISISEGGKSISVEVAPIDGKDANFAVTVTRKEGENTSIAKFEIKELSELKEKDQEAYDLFVKHTGANGGGGARVGGFGGNTAAFDGGLPGMGGAMSGPGSLPGFGSASGSSSGGGSTSFSTGPQSSQQSQSQSSNSSDSSSDQQSSSQAQVAGDASGPGSMALLIQQMMQIRAQNADKPELIKAIDDFIRQYGGQQQGGGRVR